MTPIPAEFAIGGVYLSPLLVASIIGTLATAVTAGLLNRLRLSRYFYNPPLILVALMVIYTIIIDTFLLARMT